MMGVVTLFEDSMVVEVGLYGPLVGLAGMAQMMVLVEWG